MRREDGSVAVETAIVAPVLLVLMLLVVYAGRASQADANVRVAAARAASIAADPARATHLAEVTAAGNLQTAGVVCQTTSTTVDTGEFRAGGTVTVMVACQVSNRDIALLAVPGTRWSFGTATQMVDTYRGGA